MADENIYISSALARIVCITDQTHILYFSIFFAFLIQNEKSFSRIREKMQINVG